MNFKTIHFIVIKTHFYLKHISQKLPATQDIHLFNLSKIHFLGFGNQVRVAIRLRSPAKLLIVDFLTEQIMLKRSFSGCRALWVMTAAVVRLSCLHLFYSFTLYLPYSFNTPVLHQSLHLQPTVTVMNPRPPYSPTTKLDKCIRTHFKTKL